MKNKTLKNFIALGALAILILGASSVSAAYPYDYPYETRGYSQHVYSPSYSGNSNSNYYNTTSAYPNYNTSTTSSVQYTYLQQPAQVQQVQQAPQQPQIIYVQQPAAQVQQATQPQIIYVDRPATTTTVQAQAQPYTYVQPQVKYVQQPATVQYVNTGSTQGASVLGASVANTRVVTTGAKNSGTASNTGQFVNYDANNQVILANAYGAYNNGQVVTPMAYDTNGVTALSVGGSGGFMPSSVFQWIVLIIIILGIIIIARMISRTFSKDPHGTPVH